MLLLCTDWHTDVAGALNTKMKSEQYQNSFRIYTSTLSCSLNRREVHFSAQEVHEGRHLSSAFSMLWLEKKHIAVRSEVVDCKSALNEPALPQLFLLSVASLLLDPFFGSS